MTGEQGEYSLDLSHRDLISLYIILTKNESELDSTQQVVFGRVCDQVYRRLSVEQIENIDSLYESL